MEVSLLIIRLALAAIFGLAGIAKLFDADGSKKAFADFGVPDGLIKPLATALPVAELLIAGALLFNVSSWYGAIGAAAVMSVFVAAMSYQIAKGNAPDCHCFGQLHSEPVGASSIIRNVAILAVAAYLIVQGQGSQGRPLISSDTEVMPFVLGLAIVVLLVSVVLYLKRIADQQVQIMRRIELMELVARDGGQVEREDLAHPHEGLPIGAEFPEFELPDLDGVPVSLASIREEGLPALFLFVSPTCNPCGALVPEIEKWQKDLAGKARVVMISSGDSDENAEKFGGEKQILLQNDREVAESVKAQWTPTAVLMDAGGRIASRVAAGDTAIRELVHQIEHHDLRQVTYISNGNGHADHDRLGSDVPEFSLKDIKGNEINSERLKGKRTLVAFWSPTCPHCSGMLDDLREWDRSRTDADPDLIVFSDGDPAAHEQYDLESPVIIDTGYKTAEGFGMYGTPSAVLVNEQGKIVSETAIGAPDIWSLVGRRNKPV